MQSPLSGPFSRMAGWRSWFRSRLQRSYKRRDGQNRELAEERINHLCSSRRFGETIEQYICVQSLNMSRADEEKFTAFQRHLTVTAERETRLIKVVFTAPDPEVAAKVANAVVSEYLNRDGSG